MSEFRFYPNYGYKTRKRRRRKDLEGRRLKLTRVTAEVRVEEQVVGARVFLTDIFPRAIFLFSSEPIGHDTPVAVTLEAPKQFYARGRVVSCSAYRQESRVIENEKYPYRIAIGFDFETEAEAAEVRDYVADLRLRFIFK